MRKRLVERAGAPALGIEHAARHVQLVGRGERVMPQELGPLGRRGGRWRSRYLLETSARRGPVPTSDIISSADLADGIHP